MKQHITIEQLNELSEKGKEKLREWWKPDIGNIFSWEETQNNWYEAVVDEETGGLYISHPSGRKSITYPILSIGQMIELLVENSEKDKFGNYIDDSYYDYNISAPNRTDIGWDGELCDNFWEAVKEKLEE